MTSARNYSFVFTALHFNNGPSLLIIFPVDDMVVNVCAILVKVHVMNHTVWTELYKWAHGYATGLSRTNIFK